jgi:GH15 family glucan-1,4-alpha-glucosidase
MIINVEDLIAKSKDVIEDCLLDNGAIVAANATKEYYPPTAKNYFYVWPRDASYACIAADIAGIPIQEKFFNWCQERAEGFKETGLFYEKYYVNGLKALGRFQPDQTGTLLFAVWHHYKDNLEESLRFKNLIEKAADGLCGKWKEDHFEIETNDLWEERLTFPDIHDNFTYSLAACIKGLECASKMIPNNKNDNWPSVAKQMRKRLDLHFVNGHFSRSFGDLTDSNIDASMLGLVYPFEIFAANDPRIISTVKEIENCLARDGGVHRYELDQYDGWFYEGVHRNKGSGAWPLLNFWLSIYYCCKANLTHKKIDRDCARKYYNWVLSSLKAESNYLPEQIFKNDLQKSISPLLWSHVMFIIASKFMGYHIK